MPAQVENQPDSWSLASIMSPSAFRGNKSKGGKRDPADELLDLLENGFARESITQECLSPREPEEEESGKPHQRYVFKRIGKEVMELHTDVGKGSDRFLLSAKKVDDTFYISPYAFDGMWTDEPDQVRRCAVLKKVAYGASGECYKLFLDGCEGCDRNQIYEGVCEQSNEQKLLAEIWHSTTVVKEADMAMRTLRVTLPAKVKGSVRDQWETCSDSSSGSDNSSDGENSSIQLVTKLPRWVESSGCLTQKFHGNRVKSSSAKNFILTQDKSAPRADQQIVMQFGKKKKSQYIMDHAGPLSTLQAFAIALSMCNWIGE